MPRERAVRVDHGGRLADDAVAFLPADDAAADLANHAAELVAQHDRVLHRPALLARPHVQVAAAHADGLHFQQHFVVADRRARNLAQLDAVFLGREIDDALHDLASANLRA